MKQRKKSIEIILENEAEQELGINRLRIVLTIIIIILITFIVTMLVLPPQVELYELQDELKTAEQQLSEAQEAEKEARNHLRWIEDPEYIEQIARDRADQAMAGEVIIRQPEENADEETRQNVEREGR